MAASSQQSPKNIHSPRWKSSLKNNISLSWSFHHYITLLHRLKCQHYVFCKILSDSILVQQIILVLLCIVGSLRMNTVVILMV